MRSFLTQYMYIQRRVFNDSNIIMKINNDDDDVGNV